MYGIYDETSTSFSKNNLSVDNLIETANKYHLLLMNDQNIPDAHIQIFYSNEKELAKAQLLYGDGFLRIEKRIDLDSFLDDPKANTDQILSKLYCSNIVISIDNELLRNYISKKINSHIFNIKYI